MVGRLALLAAVPLVLVPVATAVVLPTVLLGVVLAVVGVVTSDGACSLEVAACRCLLSCGAWAVSLSESGACKVAQGSGTLLRCASVVVCPCPCEVA